LTGSNGLGRSVVAHDFFVTEGGADLVALEFARLLPDAEIYTTFFSRDRFGDRLAPDRVHTWPLQRFRSLERHFRSLLPLYPIFFTRLDVGPADLLLSSSIAFTHAVRPPTSGIHVSYVHTPMRYAWDLETYLDRSTSRRSTSAAARFIRPILQRWDRSTAGRPDVVVANSATVQARIRRYWDRDSTVIYPPVDVEAFRPSSRNDGYYLIASRLLHYRRIDLAVRACSDLGLRLVVVGDGPEAARLRGIAGPSIEFRGFVPRAELVDLFCRCRGYVVPGIEDFGIAPVEAMAAGKPVVAYAAGGAAETVLDGITGRFFHEPTVEALSSVLREVNATSFDPSACRRRAETFSRSRFFGEWRQLLLGLGIDERILAPDLV
jgi:glycosyltransferase involved in cell wall biosynthesis